MSAQPFRKRGGFSLKELLVVLGILVLGIGLLVPALFKTRVQSRDSQSQNNLKCLCLAVHNFNDTYRRLPPASNAFFNGKSFTVHQHLLPYVEQDNVYKKSGQDALVPPYLAMSDYSGTPTAEASPMNFAANIRIFGNTTARIDVPVELQIDMDSVAGWPRTFVDGTSNTIMYSTIFFECGPEKTQKTYARDAGGDGQGSPNSPRGAYFGANPASYDGAHFSAPYHIYQLAPGPKNCRDDASQYLQSFSRDGLIVGLGDASIIIVSPKVSARIWNRGVHPADGCQLSSEWIE